MTSIPQQLPWIEKYRPKKLADVVHQDEVTTALKNTLSSGNLPHLLFYGPPGTGKTSTVLAVARELYGPDIMKERVLELNASHERGIDVVRERIKTFAKSAIDYNKKAEGYPVPGFKIIILDEADCMTKDAQSALRRIMENYSQVTRFCIICNYVSRIIAPITSRCAKFRFKAVNSDAMYERLANICHGENIRFQSNALHLLMKTSLGDMRRAINLLQTASIVVGQDQDEITENIIHEVCGSIPESVVKTLWELSKEVQDVQIMAKAVSNVIRLGYSVDHVISRLMEYLIEIKTQKGDEEIDDVAISQLAIKIGECERRLVSGASEQTQLLDIMSACVEVNATK
jgi:replication factor C subunit 2/4